MNNIFFNAHHSPIGAFASFTLGFKGNKGGFGLELGKPANQDIYVGFESESGEFYETLPFYADAEDESRRYDIENKSSEIKQSVLVPFRDEQITRDYKLGSDIWNAGDMTFTVYSPVCSVPDPDNSDEDDLKKVINPAVYFEITLDNTKGNKKRKAFFGLCSKERFEKVNIRRLDDVSEGKYTGIGQGREFALVSKDCGVKSACGFTLEKILTDKFEENWTFGLGATCTLIMEVEAGEKRKFSLQAAFTKAMLLQLG